MRSSFLFRTLAPWRRASALLLLTLGLCAAPACRRPGKCPPDQDETRVSDNAFWCRDPRTKSAVYVQLHPGTRQWKQRCPFTGGRLEGAFEAAHPGGQRWVKGSFVEGRVVGTWTQWDPSGTKVAEGDYRAGRLVSGAPVAVASICEAVPALQ